MANLFHTSMSAKAATFFSTLFQMIGVSSADMSRSKGVGVTLKCLDGDAITAEIQPLDQGNMIRKLVESGSLVVPSGGAADLDGDVGTATLVASTVDVTVPGGVPVGSLVYAIATTREGVHKFLTAVRKSATEITISSAGSGFGALLDSAGASGALTAGENAAIALVNAAGDLLAVKQTAAAGAAADHFSVVRVSDALVKVQAHDAAGALVAGNTSTVKVYNLGQAGHDTSLVRWAVVRPLFGF